MNARYVGPTREAVVSEILQSVSGESEEERELNAATSLDLEELQVLGWIIED